MGTLLVMAAGGIHIETLENPSRYAPEQIERACLIAGLLKRGTFVLVEPPELED